MTGRTPDHQEQEADPRPMPHQDVHDGSPVHSQPSPSAAAHRALRQSGKLAPRRVLALQRTVGNRAVQRIVAERARPGIVQRHISEQQKSSANVTIFSLSASERALGDVSRDLKREAEHLARTQRNMINSTRGARNFPCHTGFSRAGGETTGGYNRAEGEIPTGQEEETQSGVPASGGV